MVDLSQLPASQFAAQLARPSGEVGVAVGDYMKQLNGRLIMAAYQRLAPPTGGRVVEIGFGNGKLIAELLAMAPGLTYVGVEVSETMVAAAGEHNFAHLQQGRVELHLASVEHLPFPEQAFDRALAVNTIYFWPDQVAGLRELRRVLRGEGWLVLASMTPEASAKSPTARAEYGFHVLDRDALVSLHRVAGFRGVECDIYEEQNTRLDGTVFQRSYHIVLARP
jgi:ubiquinone/menaquinone biosynthesis C-methylase UbiE